MVLPQSEVLTVRALFTGIVEQVLSIPATSLRESHVDSIQSLFRSHKPQSKAVAIRGVLEGVAEQTLSLVRSHMEPDIRRNLRRKLQPTAEKLSIIVPRKLLPRTGQYSIIIPERCNHYAEFLNHLSRAECDVIFWGLILTNITLLGVVCFLTQK